MSPFVRRAFLGALARAFSIDAVSDAVIDSCTSQQEWNFCHLGES